MDIYKREYVCIINIYNPYSYAIIPIIMQNVQNCSCNLTILIIKIFSHDIYNF